MVLARLDRGEGVIGALLREVIRGPELGPGLDVELPVGVSTFPTTGVVPDPAVPRAAIA